MFVNYRHGKRGKKSKHHGKGKSKGSGGLSSKGEEDGVGVAVWGGKSKQGKGEGESELGGKSNQESLPTKGGIAGGKEEGKTTAKTKAAGTEVLYLWCTKTRNVWNIYSLIIFGLRRNHIFCCV